MSPQEDAHMMSVDPLALEPYSPVLPGRGPERSDSDPLALDPYSPVSGRRAPDRWSRPDGPFRGPRIARR
jgi:hypothetical protein